MPTSTIAAGQKTGVWHTPLREVVTRAIKTIRTANYDATPRGAHGDILLEILFEEGKARATNDARRVCVLVALMSQLRSDDGRSTQEDAHVLALVILPDLLEDATPIRPSEVVVMDPAQMIDLLQFDLASQEDADDNVVLRWALNGLLEQICEPIQLFLASHNPIEIDAARHLYHTVHQVTDADLVSAVLPLLWQRLHLRLCLGLGRRCVYASDCLV